MPASIPNGAALIACSFVASGSGTPTASVPSGWTSVRDLYGDATYDTRLHVFKRIASSEPTSYTASVSHSLGGWNTYVAAYTGVDTTSLATMLEVENGADASNTTPSVVSSIQGSWWVSLFGGAASSTSATWTADAGTERQENTSNGSVADLTSSYYDSNGEIAPGSYSIVGTPSSSLASPGTRVCWVGVLAAPPLSGNQSRHYRQAVRRASYY